MFCTRCGSELPDGTRFCTKCGAEQKSAPAPDPAFESKTPEPVHPQQARVPQSAMPARNVPSSASAAQFASSQPKKRAGSRVYVAIVAGVAAVAAIVLAVLLVPQLLNRDVVLDEETFPDEGLRELVSSRYDADGNGRLDPDEVSSIAVLELDGVSDYEGIERFTSAKKLVVKNSSTPTVVIPGGTSIEEFVLEDGSVKSVQVPEDNKFESIVVPNDDVDIHGLEYTKLHEWWIPTSLECPRVLTIPSESVEYDELGRASKFLWSGSGAAETVYSYNDINKVATSDEQYRRNSYQTEMTYDDQGALAKAKFDESGSASALSFTYGDKSLHATLSSGSGNSLKYDVSYDDKGSLLSFSYATSSSTTSGTFTYDDAGRIKTYSYTDSNGERVTEAMTWSSDGKLSKIEKKDSSRTLSETEFTYDGNGRLERADERSYRKDGIRQDVIVLTAMNFTYNEHGLPTKWGLIRGVDQGSGEGGEVKVAYTRVITSDESYRPQQILLFSNPLYPSFDSEFWNPVSRMEASAVYCDERLPILPTSVETTAEKE